MMCPKQAKIMWPKERRVWRGSARYDMGPDEVVCDYENAFRAEYVTLDPTPEGWYLRIIATRTDGNVYEKKGQRYAIRWGFVD